MKPQVQRILAVIGLVLICASIVCMLGGMFAGTAKALLMQISFVSFIGAAGILLALGVVRGKDKKDESLDDK